MLIVFSLARYGLQRIGHTEHHGPLRAQRVMS